MRIHLDRLTVLLEQRVAFAGDQRTGVGEPEISAARVQGAGRALDYKKAFAGKAEIQRIVGGLQQALREIGPLPLDHRNRRRARRILAGRFGGEESEELAIAFVSARGRIRKIVRDKVERLHA